MVRVRERNPGPAIGANRVVTREATRWISGSPPLEERSHIAGARANDSPNSDAIGRGMEVNKEEILGMMAAVDVYVKVDHAAEWREFERRTQTIAESVKGVSGVQTEMLCTGSPMPCRTCGLPGMKRRSASLPPLSKSCARANRPSSYDRELART